MKFTMDTIEKSWKRAGGRCESCSKKLIFTSMNKSYARGAWNTFAKNGLVVGPDTPRNCIILCWTCWQKKAVLPGLKK
ncbi:MAG: hypothetical protein ACQESP_03085 [Candidatus Muiribacteriota bacterium]